MTLAIVFGLVAALAAVLFVVSMVQRLVKLALFVAVVGAIALAGWLAVRDHAPEPVKAAVASAAERAELAGEQAAKRLADDAVQVGKQATDAAAARAKAAVTEAKQHAAAAAAPAPAPKKP